MAHSLPPAAIPRKRRAPIWNAVIAGAILLASLATILVCLWMNSPKQGESSRPEQPTEGPKGIAEAGAWEALLHASPYRNVQPGVAYVSDAYCAECHNDIAESFARHPMGRSLNPVAQANAIEEFTAEARHPLGRDGFVYRVRREGERQFHQEARLSPAGKEALVTEFEAVYSVGSGRTARSYFIERDEHLFMSPLTWYADHGWDLSPGYEVNNSHFNRPVVSECLFCHANRALHVEGTLNGYKPPFFEGHGIGCQRCHGPGELHVAARKGSATAEPDVTIVNPARLEPRLRESVCEQCHLGGLVRVETRGRRREDFRPGLPWSAVEAVYLAATPSKSKTNELPTREGPDRFVGHVEQMHLSRCYTGSLGKLGCISCHDPHRLPEEASKAKYYRRRCLECHGEASCKLPLDERRARGADDSCIACHMPRAHTQIQHAAATDHRIPRSSDAPVQRPAPTPSPDWSPLIAFDLPSLPNVAAGNDPDETRNLAIALTMAMERHPEVADATLLLPTIGLLEQALERDPSDDRAREAYAFALARGRDLAPALRQIEQVLEREPRRESTVVAAASMLTGVGQWSEAAERWDRARKLNPWIVRYWYELARCYARCGRWNDCAATCEEALVRFPDSFGARQLLIESRLIAGRIGEAQKEYERMIELSPPKIDTVRRWWENHPLRQR
jgi:tetratricopeptide (TPR) repeat protein